jgi:hypothetical protein
MLISRRPNTTTSHLRAGSQSFTPYQPAQSFEKLLFTSSRGPQGHIGINGEITLYCRMIQRARITSKKTALDFLSAAVEHPDSAF